MNDTDNISRVPELVKSWLTQRSHTQHAFLVPAKTSPSENVIFLVRVLVVHLTTELSCSKLG